MNKQSRDKSSVLSEWHDRGERRPISSGDSMAYEYALPGCLEFILSYMRFAGDPSKFMILYMALMALRETTEDSTEITPTGVIYGDARLVQQCLQIGVTDILFGAYSVRKVGVIHGEVIYHMVAQICFAWCYRPDSWYSSTTRSNKDNVRDVHDASPTSALRI